MCLTWYTNKLLNLITSWGKKLCLMGYEVIVVYLSV